MRAADAATILRMLLVAAVAYMVLARYNAWIALLLFVVAVALDAVDGFLAAWQASGYRLSVAVYARAALLKDRIAASKAAKYKRASAARAPFGPRMDIAGDRFVEYAMWIVFALVGIVPLFIVLAVVFVHSIADALMGVRGTSSRMRTRLARAVYSSNASRALINLLKVAAFGYLIVMYVGSYPAIYGAVLVYSLFAFVMLRGFVEIYESMK